MQTLRIVITLSHLRALHDALRETFLKVTNNEILTAKRHQALWCLRRTVGRIEKKKETKRREGVRGRGGGG